MSTSSQWQRRVSCQSCKTHAKLEFFKLLITQTLQQIRLLKAEIIPSLRSQKVPQVLLATVLRFVAKKTLLKVFSTVHEAYFFRL